LEAPTFAPRPQSINRIGPDGNGRHAFWDSHSLSDYEEHLEPAALEMSIERRHFEIEVDEQSFQALRSTAQRQNRPVKQVASEILKRQLAAP
jgi:hypothetical protein